MASSAPQIKQLQALDGQLQQLLQQRAAVLQGMEAPLPQALLEYRATLAQTSGLSVSELQRLLTEIHGACLAACQPVQVAYLGPEGTFTQAAVHKHFGQAVLAHPQASIDDVFRQVEAGQVQYGVVPVENSTEGVVNHTLDRFMSSPLKICAELELRIHQNLLVQHEQVEVKRIYSHQQSLAQCRAYLSRCFPQAEQVAVSSNAKAARRAATEADCAAIAGELAARTYGLTIQARNIEDKPDNSTRFLVIAPQAASASGRDKTSILVSAANRPGMLHSLLAPLKDSQLTMTRIESRPSQQLAWAYVFFIDIEGHCDEPAVATALAQLQQQAQLYRWLGSYPAAGDSA